MEIAISGATGFIGEKLVDRYLASGDSVRIISRRKYTEINKGGIHLTQVGTICSIFWYEQQTTPYSGSALSPHVPRVS